MQEALTNVVRHSGSSHCGLTLDRAEREIFIEVTDHGPDAAAGTWLPGTWPPDRSGPVAVPAGGHGIIGMAERVRLYGGQFSAGPLPGQGFRVTARIPAGGRRDDVVAVADDQVLVRAGFRVLVAAGEACAWSARLVPPGGSRWPRRYVPT